MLGCLPLTCTVTHLGLRLHCAVLLDSALSVSSSAGVFGPAALLCRTCKSTLSQVFVGPFKRREDRGTPGDKFTNVYVKNLAESVTDEKLKE